MSYLVLMSFFVVRGGAGGMVPDPNQPKSLRGGRTTSMMNMSDLSIGGGSAYNGAAGGVPTSPGIFQRFMGGVASPAVGGSSIATHSAKL